MANDLPTVIAAGVAAATLAALCHETIGHGLGCTLAGGRVALLTSIFFRCSVVSPLSDAGGPLGNCVAGGVALGLVSRRGSSGGGTLLLLMFGCINAFWFSAQLVRDALLDTDDWAFLHYLRSPLVWRSGAVALGLAGYAAAMKVARGVITRAGEPFREAVPLSYLAAAIAGFLPALIWAPDRPAGAVDDFLTFSLAPLGLLLVWARAGKAAHGPEDLPAISRSWLMIVSSALIFGLFMAVQAPGLGELSSSRLIH